MAKVSRQRRFSRAFKLKVISRMEAGESASELSRELNINRVILYHWRELFRRGGELALRSGSGRPKRAEALAMAAARGSAGKASDLAEARRQIAALEAKVGRQQLDLDFFKQALQRIEASRRPSERPGVTASSSRSKR
jgi:transposase-like protein